MASQPGDPQLYFEEAALQDCTCYPLNKQLYELQWLSLNNNNNNVSPPSARGGHTANYINALDQLLIFGGSNRMAQFYNDVYLYNYNKKLWKLQINNSSNNNSKHPAPRAGHAAVYVQSTNKLYIHGGQLITMDSNTGEVNMKFYNDIWELDISNWQWKLLNNTDNTPARNGHSLSLFHNNELILFGGSNENGPTNSLFTYNIANNAWNEINNIVGNKPQAREMHASCMVNNQLIIASGRNESGLCNDFYSFNYNNANNNYEWKLLGQCPARCSHSLIAVPTNNANNNNNTNNNNSDSNNHNNNNNDSNSSKNNLNLLMFGGSDGMTFYNDLLIYSSNNIEQKNNNINSLCSKCNGPHGWTLISGGNSGQDVPTSTNNNNNTNTNNTAATSSKSKKKGNKNIPKPRFAHSLTQIKLVTNNNADNSSHNTYNTDTKSTENNGCSNNDNNNSITLVLFGGLNAEHDLNDIFSLQINGKNIDNNNNNNNRDA